VVPAPEEVAAAARVAAPGLAAVMAAATTQVAAMAEVSPLAEAVMASAEPLQQEEEVSSSMGAHCRCCHRHHRHRSLTRPERRQV